MRFTTPLLLFFIVAGTSCAHNIEKQDSGSIDSISLQIVPDSIHLPISNVYRVVENNTSRTLFHSDMHQIEIYDNGKWRTPEVSQSGLLRASLLTNNEVPPHTIERYKIGLWYNYYNYKPGKYRVIKEFKQEGNKNKEKYYIEFHIVE